MSIGRSVSERIRDLSSPSGDCLVFTGYQDRDGYGYLKVAGRNTPAHRAAYMAAHGPIESDVVVRHRCDNPPCVKLSHLEPGTHADNVNDKLLRGRVAHGEGNASSKLSEEGVIAIRLALASGARQRELAEQYEVSQSAISRIKTGMYWVRAGAAA